MGDAETILTGVTTFPDYAERIAAAYFDGYRGFLITPDRLALEGIKRRVSTVRETIIAFGVSGWQDGTDAVEDKLIPKTGLQDYCDASLRVPGRVNRGVGPRLYNTLQAVRGTQEDYPLIGAYALSVRQGEEYVFDGRRSDDFTRRGQLRQKARYAAFVGQAWRHGLEAAVETVHARQASGRPRGALDIAVYHQPARGQALKAKREAAASAVPEQMLIVRNPNLVAYLVGVYQRPATLTSWD